MGADKDKKSKDGDPGNHTDLESSEQKLPYPKSVFFIVTNEFCERFSYYGMKAVLTLYLKNVLNYSEDTATIIYHVFSMFCYFTPVFGAMIADSLLGKFRTIFYLSVVYAIGNVVLALAATTPLHIPAVPFSMIGLALIAVGTGGIKPCVAAFGGDQFVLPQQTIQLASFFSFFYMAINSGSLISTFITPIMRKDVQCFDQDSCYSLAFALPAALMVVSLIIFLIGKPLYRMVDPTGNVVLKLIKCIGHAISQKRKTKAKREHWLDNADDVYEPRFIEDVKIVLRVLVLYLPLPVFWALFDQQGSRWTLQATRMDGVVSGFTIKPDQVQVLNPVLILLFIPLFDKVIYPLLNKCGLFKRPLQRLTMGGLLAGVAFIASGMVELELEKTYPNRLESHEANLQFVNTLPCNITLGLMGREPVTIIKYNSYVFETVEAKNYTFDDEKSAVQTNDILIGLTGCPAGLQVPEPILVTPIKSADELANEDREEENEKGGGFTYVIGASGNNIGLAYSEESDQREKPAEGNPKLKFIVAEDGTGFSWKDAHFFLDGEDKDKLYTFQLDNKNTGIGFSSATIEVEPKTYKLAIRSKIAQLAALNDVELKLGGSYVITVSALKGAGSTEASDFEVRTHTITAESSLHMFWLLPQYIILTAGEIMFSITGLEFSYSQAPVSMKAVLQSAWLLTVAFGNLIDVIVAAAHFFPEQSKEFFLFAGLMFADMIWFSFMAWRYVPAQLEDPNKKKSIAESKNDNE